MVKVLLEKMEANKETLEVKMEANQEMIKAMAEHCEGVPHAEITQEWAASILQEVPKGAMDEETIGATEDPSADQQLIMGYHEKLKTRTEDNGKSLQEVAAAI
jgi:hypothetical protein